MHSRCKLTRAAYPSALTFHLLSLSNKSGADSHLRTAELVITGYQGCKNGAGSQAEAATPSSQQAAVTQVWIELLLTLILSAVLTAVEAMDSALSIWELKGCTDRRGSPSMDRLRMDWSLRVRGREPKLETLGIPALACRLTTPKWP